MDDARKTGTTGKIDFSPGVAEFGEGGRGDEDGGGGREAQKGCRRVAFGDVNEDAWTEEDLTEGFCVFVFR